MGLCSTQIPDWETNMKRVVPLFVMTLLPVVAVAQAQMTKDQKIAADRVDEKVS